MPSIDFAKAESQSLILQIIHETGPSSDCIERKSHRILTEESFANAMLDQLEGAHQKQSLNWDSWRAVACFVQLTRRVLNLSASRNVITRSLILLGAIRQTCASWLERIQQRAADTTNGEQRTNLYTRFVDIALICCSTFDVEEKHIVKVLQQANAISILLRCSIIICENQQSTTSDFMSLHKAALHDWRRLSFRLFPLLHKHVLQNGTGLNHAVSQSWAAFAPSTGKRWKIVDKERRSWLMITSGSLPVHFNMLTGELLINGAPLARLSEEYTRHSLYSRLFQETILDIGPTDEPGMQYSAKLTHYGNKLHFGMSNGDMLVVATKHESR